MDPMLGEPAITIRTPASYYADPQNPAAPTSVPSAAQQPQSSYSDAQSAPAQDIRSAYPYAHDADAYSSHAQPASNAPTVDVQALLDQLSTPANNAVSSQFQAPPMPHHSDLGHAHSPTASLPAAGAVAAAAAASLPPRPPPQDKGATNPNYNPNDDIRSYHPHSGHRASSQLPPATTRGAAGDQHIPPNQSPGAPSSTQRQTTDQDRMDEEKDDDEDKRWTKEINVKYEHFLNEERKFVTEGQWEKFPYGSRLFIGK